MTLLCGTRSLARHTSHMNPAPTNTCHTCTHRRFLKTTWPQNSGIPQETWHPERKGNARTESTHPHAPPHDIFPNLCVFPHQMCSAQGSRYGTDIIRHFIRHQTENVGGSAGTTPRSRRDAENRKVGNLACSFLICSRLPCHLPSLLTAYTPHNTQDGPLLPCSTQPRRRLDQWILHQR